MRKLIHINKNVRPGGGPAGYLYNLKKILEKNDCNSIEVFSFSFSDERTSPISRKIKFIELFPLYIRNKLIYFLIRMKMFIDIYLIIKLIFSVDKNDLFVFHDQNLAYVYSLLTKKAFFVMPHQPVEFAREIAEEYSSRYNVDFSVIYEFYAEKEQYVYLKSSGIILPNKESLNAYSYINLKTIIKDKTHEIISYAVKPHIIVEKDDLLIKYPFLKGKKIVGFFGRYNEHKGFDIYLDFVERYKYNDSLYFISAGAGNILSDNRNNYFDFGWTSDIGSLISLCDLILVPNRVAYFDLLPIESLLLGVSVAITDVGGSKYLLKELNLKGVYKLNLDQNNLDDIVNNAIINGVNSKFISDIFSEKAFYNSHVDFFKNLQEG